MMSGTSIAGSAPRPHVSPWRALRRRLYPIKQAGEDLALRLKARRLARKYRDYTMIDARKYEENLGLAALVTRVDGCVVECGVWRGGMIAGIAEIVGPHRRYFLFDSFEGLPPATALDGAKATLWQADKAGASYYDNCRAEMSYSEKTMRLAGASHATFTKGWFNETVPHFTPPEPIALLRLDGDWYDSTMVCLEGLYRHVAPGGLIILDDYFHWEGCARAVHDFLSRHGLPDRIRQTPHGVCYLFRSDTPM